MILRDVYLSCCHFRCNYYNHYFSQKFYEDYLYLEPESYLLKLAPHLEPIDHDRWDELEFNDELTKKEMRGKQALEKRNMAIIEKVYQRLKDDKEIQGRIQQIKVHPWVRVVEGE